MVLLTYYKKQAYRIYMNGLAGNFFSVYHVTIQWLQGNRAVSTAQPVHYLVMTALGRDRPGIVDTVTRQVSQLGCNIEDSRFALFGETFTFIMLLSGSWNALAQLETTLAQQGAALDLLLVMKRTRLHALPAVPQGVRVEIDMDDAPHLIERFTHLFRQQQMNIAELTARTYTDSAYPQPQLHLAITAHSTTPTLSEPTLREAFTQLCRQLTARGALTILNYSSCSND